MNIKIQYLPKKYFNDLKKKISSISPTINDDIAFTIKLKNESIIVINSDNNLTNDELAIVIQHETAHAKGISSELDADIYALKYLTPKQKTLLKANWKNRHGKDYN